MASPEDDSRCNGVVGSVRLVPPGPEGRLVSWYFSSPMLSSAFGGLKRVQVVRARLGADDAAPHPRQIWRSLGKSGSWNCDSQQQRKGETNPGQHEFSG